MTTVKGDNEGTLTIVPMSDYGKVTLILEVFGGTVVEAFSRTDLIKALEPPK